MSTRKKRPDELRSLTIRRRATCHAEGAVLISAGRTQVLCTASVLDGVPPFRRGSGGGWLTAEYGMLPRATATRNEREAVKGKRNGRSMEISRLIGRALRPALRLDRIGERTIAIDCDVLQADGGTRCASITGAMVALADACAWMKQTGRIDPAAEPIACFVAAVSVGLVGGRPVLDLCYEEDAAADADMNVVMTDDGRLVEVQATAEGEPFRPAELDRLRRLAAAGIQKLIAAQRAALARKC